MTQLTSQIPLVSRKEFLTPFDSLFDNVISKAFPHFSQQFGVEFFGNNSYPKVDAIDHDDKITIEAEIPGLKKEEVAVELEHNRVLTISGQKQGTAEDASTRYIRKELKRSSFKRSFRLGENLKVSAVKADFNNGVLNITIPKRKKEEPHSVKIL
tara:strand:+ start:2567 stop:3031 length:465 start_codon:yes stop_codon:yes gene_type:complete